MPIYKQKCFQYFDYLEDYEKKSIFTGSLS